VEFRPVSEHDESAGEEHRPQRRRKHGHDEAPPVPSALQLVETQAPVQQPSEPEDDLPRRTRPRRRRAGPAVPEPLQLVETDGNAKAGDNPPTP
jgi:hypothetical protein